MRRLWRWVGNLTDWRRVFFNGLSAALRALGILNEVLWRRLFDYKFYDYKDNLSAAWIWSRIRRIGRSRYNLFREKLGYLDGGSETLLEAMRAYIEANGGQFRLKSPATKVTMHDGRVTGVEAAGQSHTFDKVISTIPLPYVPSVMPELPADILQKYKNIKNVAVVCVIVKLRKPPLPKVEPETACLGRFFCIAVLCHRSCTARFQDLSVFGRPGLHSPPNV